MSQCLNPDCLAVNLEQHKFCQQCGKPLLLKDRYQALKLIGQGGFGKTFLAIDHDKPSKPRCVIKQCFPQLEGSQGLVKAEDLFAQEAQRLEELGHHGQIPALMAYFTLEGRQYLVQEYVEGQNLEQELQQVGIFDQVKVKQLLTDLLPVLAFIHRIPVIHRDIKPENIIRRKADQKLVLVDFGAAKRVTPTNRSVTGTIIGSAEYVAPEQINGKAVAASDLYSLGVTCLYLLTGISPFQLFDSGEFEWVWRDYLVDNPVDDKLGNILDKLVVPGTKKRYQTVEEIYHDLQYKQNTQNSLIEKKVPTTEISKLDNALLNNLASRLEEMSKKILHYYKDHNATYEDAQSISNNYLESAKKLRSINNKYEMNSLIAEIHKLKTKLESFRHKEEKYRLANKLQSSIIVKMQKINSNPTPDFNINQFSTNRFSKAISDVQIAEIKLLSNYFRQMVGKTLHYYEDHQASPEEAEVLASYYLQVSDYLKKIKNVDELNQAIQNIESLKQILTKYKHESHKYNWDYNLEKHVLQKLKMMSEKNYNC